MKTYRFTITGGKHEGRYSITTEHTDIGDAIVARYRGDGDENVVNVCDDKFSSCSRGCPFCLQGDGGGKLYLCESKYNGDTRTVSVITMGKLRLNI